MSQSPNVMDLLAKARPARLDAPSGRGEQTAQVVAAIMATAPAGDGHATLGTIRRSRPLRVAVLGIAAATAAAVVVAVAGPGITPRSDPDAAPVEAPMDYRRMLLVAAERSDQAPQADGRYLTMQWESGNVVPVEAAEGTYAMVERSSSQYWLARSSADSSWAVVQQLGAEPATPADEARWRRAGAPAVMRVTKPKPFVLTTAPGAVESRKVDPDRYLALGDVNVSQAQIDALPTDPAALRGALLGLYTGENVDMPRDQDQWLFTVASSVIVNMPVSNQVRAAAYRLLATLPGVRGLGVVDDVRGRRGHAITYANGQVVPGRGLEVRLIIDLDTGQPLAEETRVVDPSANPNGDCSWLPPGALCSYSLVLAAGSTNDSPPIADARD
ncbi:CU044_5270 family protein [Micromonospora sp. HM5-17]|uniref:CU044_5270 family protein n=1 Tax=Micromonospora sp. HM5-17 TaxID=2487710 RepID=UPI0011CD3F75|nr:CU044_5270 family protein [Micromonospora sp. HM5-17]